MRILLDTQIFLWVINDDQRLSKKSRSIILDAHETYVSSASIWEAAIKIKMGKLNIQMEKLVNSIKESGFLELAITTTHAAMVASLPDLHRDLFDRILVAQAMSEPLRLLTVDKMLARYSDLVDMI